MIRLQVDQTAYFHTFPRSPSSSCPCLSLGDATLDLAAWAGLIWGVLLLDFPGAALLGWPNTILEMQVLRNGAIVSGSCSLQERSCSHQYCYKDRDVMLSSKYHWSDARAEQQCGWSPQNYQVGIEADVQASTPSHTWEGRDCNESLPVIHNASHGCREHQDFPQGNPWEQLAGEHDGCQALYGSGENVES